MCHNCSNHLGHCFEDLRPYLPEWLWEEAVRWRKPDAAVEDEYVGASPARFFDNNRLFIDGYCERTGLGLSAGGRIEASRRLRMVLDSLPGWWLDPEEWMMSRV